LLEALVLTLTLLPAPLRARDAEHLHIDAIKVKTREFR
jgi:hypothetical protein